MCAEAAREIADVERLMAKIESTELDSSGGGVSDLEDDFVLEATVVCT